MRGEEEASATLVEIAATPDRRRHAKSLTLLTAVKTQAPPLCATRTAELHGAYVQLSTQDAG